MLKLEIKYINDKDEVMILGYDELTDKFTIIIDGHYNEENLWSVIKKQELSKDKMFVAEQFIKVVTNLKNK